MRQIWNSRPGRAAIFLGASIIIPLMMHAAQRSPSAITPPLRQDVTLDPQGIGPVPAAVEGWTSVALQRPLFSPGRTAASLVTKAAPKPPALPRLTGIGIDADRKTGIFKTASGSTLVVTEGSDGGGFKVLSITANSVLITGPGGVKLLHISYDSGPPASDATASFADIAGSPWANAWTSP